MATEFKEIYLKKFKNWKEIKFFKSQCALKKNQKLKMLPQKDFTAVLPIFPLKNFNFSFFTSPLQI